MRWRSVSLLASLCLGLIGCDEAAAKPVALTRRAMPAKVRELAPQQGKGEGKGEGRGKKRNRKHDTPVYVDGKLVAAMRFSEIPPSVPITWHPLDDGHQALRFAFTDYLAALGVSVDKVRALHLYGGRRVMAISGDEVRRVGKGLHFQFSKGIGGAPAYKHAGVVDTNTSIDKISAVAVYVDSEVPEVVHASLKSREQEADQERLDKGGMRVYLDGRMLGILKRAAHAPLEDRGPVTLAAFLETLGVSLNGVHTAEVVAKDAVAASLDKKKLAADVLVEVAPQSGGRFQLAGVADGAPVEALLLYAKQKPVDRVAAAKAGL
jgi:hypothetical protein